MERQDDKLQDIPVAERAAMLKEMATKSEFQKVRRHYTQDERDQMKDFITSESISLMDAVEEFKKVQKEFNAAKKKLSTEITDALQRTKRGFSDNEEEVFMFDDQETGMMHIFDKNGLHISSRALYPDERQTRIVEMHRTGTNG